MDCLDSGEGRTDELTRTRMEEGECPACRGWCRIAGRCQEDGVLACRCWLLAPFSLLLLPVHPFAAALTGQASSPAKLRLARGGGAFDGPQRHTHKEPRRSASAVAFLRCLFEYGFEPHTQNNDEGICNHALLRVLDRPVVQPLLAGNPGLPRDRSARARVPKPGDRQTPMSDTTDAGSCCELTEGRRR